MDNFTSSLYNGITSTVEYLLERAGYDRTIQATVKECSNEATGEYKVKYQDSMFYAYSSNLDTVYDTEAQVYVLIPGNDMTQHKTIIGAVKNEGINQSPVILESDRYIEYGDNILTLKKDFGLCSYYSNDEEQIKNKIVIYNAATDINNVSAELAKYIVDTENVTINLKGFEEYIRNNAAVDTLKMGGTFQTDLPDEQQNTGNYGLIFELQIQGNDTPEIKNCIMTINDMIGNPYRFYSPTAQYQYYNIDNYNIVGINKITFYCENFSNNAETGRSYDNDIFLRGLLFQGCEALSNDDLLGTFLKVITPSGTIFFPQDISAKQRTAEAYVWSNGKVVNKDSNSLGYYWFKQNPTVTWNSGVSQLYDSLGGNGWQCLETWSDSRQSHLPGSNILKVAKSDLSFEEQVYKCVCVYNAQKLERQVSFINMGAQFKITLETDNQKTAFLVNESGDIKVYCKIFYRKDYSDDWSEELPAGVSVSSITWYQEDNWGNYTQPDRINPDDRSVIISLNQFNTKLNLNCQVVLSNNLIGCKTLTLTKVSSTSLPYTLEIINNNGAFVYDEKGVSPLADGTITVTPLKYQIYDNINNIIVLGENLPPEKAIWSFPIDEESLIRPPEGSVLQEGENGYQKTYWIKGNEMSFTIDDKYNYLENINNTIILDVEYAGRTLRAYTNIVCQKEGDNGTNGTGYTVQIVPIYNLEGGGTDGPWDRNKSYFPIVPFTTNEIDPEKGVLLKCVWDEDILKAGHWFDVILSYEGKPIFRNSHSGELNLLSYDVEDNHVDVKWSFKIHTKNKWKETCWFSVTQNGIFSIPKDGYLLDSDITSGKLAHILQAEVTYKKKTIVVSIPIGVANLHYPENQQDIYLKPYSGFKEVIYKNDMTDPHYTEYYPFALIEEEAISGETNVEIDGVKWTPVGKYYDNNDWIDSGDLIQTNGISSLQQVKPAEIYSGFCLTNALVGIVLDNEAQEIYKIHLPIHFYLNRYSNAIVNGWDGNSININDDEGVILAPLIGAGKKEKDNSFTGVFIGTTKTDETDEKSNTQTGMFGYSHGQRSIFLNSEDGSATFGISKIGSIQIKPSINQYGEMSGDPVIQSGNYSLKSLKTDGSGLSINFGNSPSITYGSKKFSVDQTGKLTANGAVINGKFVAQNQNSFDKSKITIGVDDERDLSEILLYGYEQTLDLNSPPQSKLYVTGKTHIAPGLFEYSLYDTFDYTQDLDQSSGTPRNLPDPYSYLKFKDGELKLKGGFESKTDSSDVSFQNDSSATRIKFTNQEISNTTAEVDNAIRINSNKILQLLGLIKRDGTTEEKEALLKNWSANEYANNFSTSIKNLQQILSIVERGKVYKAIFDQVLQIISDVDENLTSTKNYIEELENNLQAYIEDQVKQGVPLEEVYQQSEVQKMEETISAENQKYNDYVSKKNEQKIYLNEQRALFLKDKDALKTLLAKENIEYITLDTYSSLSGIDQTPLYIYDNDVIFNLDSINPVIQDKKECQDVAIKYSQLLKERDELYRQRNSIIAEGENRTIYAESEWSPSKFYFRAYKDGKEKGETSSIEYVAKDGMLKYKGSIDFSADPYAKLKLNAADGRSSQFYMKTFLSNDDTTEDNLASKIEMKPGFFEIETRPDEDSDFSSLKFSNGVLKLKNVEFKLKTKDSVADVAFMNKPSQTHIKFKNIGYETDEEGNRIIDDDGNPIKTELSNVKITPSVFAIEGTESTFYYDPTKGRLNYNGNINLRTKNGIFKMTDSNMVFRFGTTTADVPATSETSNQPPKKLTDFRLTPTGFSFKSYGNLKVINPEFKSEDPSTWAPYAAGAYQSLQEQQDTDTQTLDKYSGEDMLALADSWYIAEDGLNDNEIEKCESYFNLSTIEDSENQIDLDQIGAENGEIVEDTVYVPVYDYIEDEETGKQVWDIVDQEAINVKNNNVVPTFMDSSKLSQDENWGLKSGLFYDSKIGKLRLSGNFTLKNNNGMVMFTDDIMKIMFKKSTIYQGNVVPLIRTSIGQESFYFYSFGLRNVELTKNLNTETTEKITCGDSEWGVISGLRWRNGELDIIGNVTANQGNIGGWEIARTGLTSPAGTHLDARQGQLYVDGNLIKGKDGNSYYENDTAALISTYYTRRAMVTKGEFLVEKSGMNADTQDWLKELQDIQDNFMEAIKGVEYYSSSQGKKVTFNYTRITSVLRNKIFIPAGNDIEKFCKKNLDREGATFTSLMKTIINNNEQSVDQIRTAKENYQKDLQDLVEKWSKFLGEDPDAAWTDLGHIFGGYDQSEGMFIASNGTIASEMDVSEEGQDKLRVLVDTKEDFSRHPKIDNGTVYYPLDSQENGQRGQRRPVSIGLDFEREYDEREVVIEGEEEPRVVKYLNEEQTKLNLIDSTVITITETSLNTDYVLEDGVRTRNGEKDTPSLGCLNFVLKDKYIESSEEEEDDVPNGYIYGTQIMPHVVKTNDICITDAEVVAAQDEYADGLGFSSNSLVEILRELRLSKPLANEYLYPKKASYNDSTHSITETWVRKNKNFPYYKWNNTCLAKTFDENDSLTEEEETYNEVWQLDVLEEDGKVVEVTGMTLQAGNGHDSIHIDLEGFTKDEDDE